MSSVKPYTISTPEERLQRLKQKLALTDFPDEIDDVGWTRGAPLADVKRLCEYWRTSFDWRKMEARLNELPQYTVPIEIEGFETLDIHFVHVKSEVKGAIPLLFVHGWPGSFVEVEKLIPELTKGGTHNPSFSVVCPSLPNFGFSQGTKKKGFGLKQHAEACHKLMLSLGYTQYVTQGGDLGHFITRTMSLNYPDSCRATHLNMAQPREPTATYHPEIYALTQETPLTESEKAGLERNTKFRSTGGGYFMIQATNPQTIGYSMADSPAGLLAWIYVKMHDWSDDYPWTPDEVCTWVSIYWFSRAGPAASQRIYFEGAAADPKASEKVTGWIDKVKIGYSRFPKELILMPKLWLRTLGDVVFENEWDRGGHFASHERPDALVQDLRTMFGRRGGAFGCVEGASGYVDSSAVPLLLRKG